MTSGKLGRFHQIQGIPDALSSVKLYLKLWWGFPSMRNRYWFKKKKELVNCPAFLWLEWGPVQGHPPLSCLTRSLEGLTGRPSLPPVFCPPLLKQGTVRCVLIQSAHQNCTVWLCKKSVWPLILCVGLRKTTEEVSRIVKCLTLWVIIFSFLFWYLKNN